MKNILWYKNNKEVFEMAPRDAVQQVDAASLDAASSACEALNTTDKIFKLATIRETLPIAYADAGLMYYLIIRDLIN